MRAIITGTAEVTDKEPEYARPNRIGKFRICRVGVKVNEALEIEY